MVAYVESSCFKVCEVYVNKDQHRKKNTPRKTTGEKKMNITYEYVILTKFFFDSLQLFGVCLSRKDEHRNHISNRKVDGVKNTQPLAKYCNKFARYVSSNWHIRTTTKKKLSKKSIERLNIFVKNEIDSILSLRSYKQIWSSIYHEYISLLCLLLLFLCVYSVHNADSSSKKR